MWWIWKQAIREVWETKFSREEQEKESRRGLIRTPAFFVLALILNNRSADRNYSYHTACNTG